MFLRAVPYAVMVLSGFAGLGYEMVWVRALSAGLGHEIISVLAVLAAFFVGIAAGAWLLEHPIRSSSRPQYWYAGLEMVIALWAIALSYLIPAVAPATATLMDVQPPAALQWSVTFFLPLFLLLPATMAMGATLPAMECLVIRLQRNRRVVGGLYGANTLGAVAGTLLTTFWLVPAVGFGHTQCLLAGANAVSAMGIFAVRIRNTDLQEIPGRENSTTSPLKGLLGIVFLTGLLGVGYEVVSVRIVSQVLENTVFSYAALLSIYLLGTAMGAAAYQKYLVAKNFIPLLNWLVTAQSLACLAGMWILYFSAGVYDAASLMGARTAEFSVAAAIFLAPTLVMGALFSHLAQAAKHRYKALGTAISINTLGGALAPLLFGIILIPAWGPAGCMVAVCAGYALILAVVRPRAIIPVAGYILATGLTFFLTSPFDFTRLAAEEVVVAHRHGIMAGVTVVRDDRQAYHLKVNNHYQMGGTASRYSDRRQAHIPLMLHNDPKLVLFLGLGTGTTFAAAGCYDGLQVDGVELIPEVVPLMPYFQPSEPECGDGQNMRVYVADARRFVLARRQQYDVIIADLFHPSRDGAGFLYTKEHFTAVRRRLSPDGLFCQWLPLYQMDLDLMRLIIRTFVEVFPHSAAFVAHHSLTQPIIGLIGSPQPLSTDFHAYSRRLAGHPGLAAQLHSVGLSTSYTLLGCYLAEGSQLREFAGPGPLNTDDHPRVLFEAPEFVYSHDMSSPSAANRIMTMVQALTPRVEDILTPTASVSERKRLAACWKARDAFLELGARTPPTTDLKRLITRVAAPLLDIVRTSPDFEAAYRPLLSMAARMYPQSPQTAEELLTALEAASPQRPEARRMRLRLSNSAD